MTVAAQKMTIVTPDNQKISVDIVSDVERQRLIGDFKGKQDNTVRKEWTARTYRLSDSRLLLEFYDKNAALINNDRELEQLKDIRFTRNYIDFLKKDVSYKISIAFEKGQEIARRSKHIAILKSTSGYSEWQVYEMPTGQILFLYKYDDTRTATIYENMKGLSSDNSDVQDQFYKGMEAWEEKLVSGDPLLDFEGDGYLVDPGNIPALMKNHGLSFVESKIYVSDFYGNLYRSSKGYYILVDEVNQENGAGNRMLILTVRVYPSLDDVRAAQAKYENRKREGYKSRHFYQEISDKYGKNFSSHTEKLINKLPALLNIDKEQVTFDANGMAIVDEAIRWHHHHYRNFDNWFPAVLAYYGKCYMIDKKDGEWIVKKENDYNVLVPHLVLKNKEDAFDMYDFYKDLYEWPHSLKEAGDWDGSRKNMRKLMRLDNNR